MNTLFWLSLAMFAFIAGAQIWLRVRRGREPGVPTLSDDDIRRLERGESIHIEPPLDLDEVAEAEERFWEETWDEPSEPW